MGKTTILVVEDDLHLMEGIRDILQINGYEVLTATNGVAGLDVLKAQPAPPDLIVSDIMMPRMDGYEFFNAVRSVESWVAIPFIFLTAKGEREDIKRGKRMGAEDYVVKPFDADDLLVAVSAKLNRKKQLDEVWQSEMSGIKHNILTILNHELRTPLTYVVAYADMLHRDADESRGRYAHLPARHEYGRDPAASHGRELHLLVELETGKRRPPCVRKQFPAISRRCGGDRARQIPEFAQERGVTLQVEVEDDPPAVKADHEYVRGHECLADNAIKFTDEPGGVVVLRAYADGERLPGGDRRGAGYSEHNYRTSSRASRPREIRTRAPGRAGVVDGIAPARRHLSIDSTFGQGSTFVTCPLPRTT